MINDTQPDNNPQRVLQEAEKLSDAELLAILLGSGRKNQTVLAEELLAHFGDLPRLLEAKPEDFRDKMGRKTQPLVILKACLELNRRYLLGRVKQGNGVLIRQGTCELLQSPQIAQPSELFLTLYFDLEQHLIRFEETLCGSQQGTTVYHGEQLINQVVERALQLQATEVSFMHCPPPSRLAGCPMPIDVFLGQWLFCALGAVQVKLLDYAVMWKSGSVSLDEKDFLKNL